MSNKTMNAEEIKKTAIQFAEWMSGIIESNYQAKGSWYVPSKGRILTSEELFTLFQQQQAQKPEVNEGKVLDKFGHHTFWKFCPGCGIDWEEDSEQAGCWGCGFTK